MKKFSAVYLMLFLAIFVLMASNLEFFSRLVPNQNTEISEFWNEPDLMIVAFLILFAMLVFSGIVILMKLFSMAVRKR